MFEYLCVVFNVILLIFCLFLKHEVRVLKERTYEAQMDLYKLSRERKEADEKEAKLFEGLKNIFDYDIGTARKAVTGYGDED